MRLYQFLYAVLCLAILGLPSRVVHAGEAVSLGVFPYVTPVQLVKFHNPLRARLEEALGRPVSLVTAPSFKEFIKRTQSGVYDYVLTAPHLGRLAEYRDGYTALVKTGHQVKGIYLARKDSAIRELKDIEGKSLMMVGKAAIIGQLVVRQLKEMGLEDGVNMEIRTTATHNNAMYASVRGESDVSVTGILLYEKIGQEERDKVRVIGETPGVPGFIFLASAGQSELDKAKVRTSLLSYGETEAGQQYFGPTGFKALLPVDLAEMESLQPFIQHFLKK